VLAVDPARAKPAAQRRRGKDRRRHPRPEWR
jgi:hypothetical protein